jgi:DNA-directed RNA polymerase subunit RPC12/RpoP
LRGNGWALPSESLGNANSSIEFSLTCFLQAHICSTKRLIYFFLFVTSMVDAQIPMQCSSCKKKVPFMSMKYDKTKENLLCLDCYNRQNPPKAEKAVKTGVPYICDRCKYKFMVKQKKEIILCPYCGRNDVTPAKNFTADNLLNDTY